MYFVILKTGEKVFLNKEKANCLPAGDYVFFDKNQEEDGSIVVFSPALVTKDSALSSIIFAENATKMEMDMPGGSHVN